MVKKVFHFKYHQTNTQHLEDQIDIMVYKVYNLTYEEVEIIDLQIGSIINKEDYLSGVTFGEDG